MSEEIFKPVNKENIPHVLKLLQRDWPKHFLLYQILTILDEYKKCGVTWEHTLYLYGDYETGVYLNRVYVEEPHMGKNYFYVYTADEDDTAFTTAVCNTKLVPWKTGAFFFLLLKSTYRPVIKELLVSNGTICQIHKCNTFWFPQDKKLVMLPLPGDVYLKFLDESFAEEMDRNWEHRTTGSLVTHTEHLKWNFGIGLFRKSDNKMLSSALCNYTGGIFMLHSDPEFRGRRYATYVVQGLTMETLRRGRIPFTNVVIDNKPSENVFKRIGFELFGQSDFIFPDN